MTTDTTPSLPGIGSGTPPEQPDTSPCVDASPADSGVSPDDLAPPGHDGPWRPATLSDLDFCLERVGEFEAEVDEIRSQFARAVETLSKRADAIAAQAERGAAWFRSLAEGFVLEARGDLLPGKKKSRDFLHGRVSFRSHAEKLVVTDKAALVAWLESQPDVALYRLKVEPEMKALQAKFKATGELPPGCDFEPASETLTITAAPPVTLEDVHRKEIES